MFEDCATVERACRKFMEEDDTTAALVQDLAVITEFKSNVGDRLSKVVKDLNVVRNMFKRLE